MNAAAKTVFLVDVDNTLLDNDRVETDLGDTINRERGAGSADRYWTAFEALRENSGGAAYLEAFQRCWRESDHDPSWLPLASFLLDYPFADRIYPQALAVIAHLRTLGHVVLVSDGDAVLQPRKIQRAGLWQAVEGNVLIYLHKENNLDDIARRWPARRYVMVDDKLRLLDAIKQQWRDRVTTVQPRQGHYALDPALVTRYPAADLAIEHIGELASFEWAEFAPTELSAR